MFLNNTLYIVISAAGFELQKRRCNICILTQNTKYSPNALNKVKR